MPKDPERFNVCVIPAMIVNGIYVGPLYVGHLCLPPNMGNVTFVNVNATSACFSNIGNNSNFQSCTIGNAVFKSDCECEGC